MKKHLLLQILLMITINSAIAQTIEWQKTIGGQFKDEISDAISTPDGGFLLGGLSDSDVSGNKTCINKGYEDYFVVKLDSTGNIQWQQSYGGNAFDRLTALISTSDGGYLLGGSSWSGISGDKTQMNLDSVNNVYADYWFVKIDASGNIQWDRTLGMATGHESVTKMIQLTNGEYLIGGLGLTGFLTNFPPGHGDEEVCLIKLDANGNVIWENIIGGLQTDYLTDLKPTADGGFVILATSNSVISGDKTADRVGFEDYWVVKLDANLSIQWDKTIGATEEDFSSSIIQTSDGGYLVSGHSFSGISGNKTASIGGSGDLDGWLVRLDVNGAIMWDHVYGGTIDNYMVGQFQFADGGYLLALYTASGMSGNKTDAQRGYWIVRTDASGNIQWQNAIGGSVFTDQLRKLVPSADGNFLLAGVSSSPAYADKTESSLGYDYWVIKVKNGNNLISGNLFADANNNQVHDAGELSLPNTAITESATGSTAYSDANGDYNAWVCGPGSFSVSPASVPYYTITPSSHTVGFSGINQSALTNDFSYAPAGTFDDLEINITPADRFRPGFQSLYIVTYRNAGTTSLTGTVTFQIPPDISYLSSTLSPQNVSASAVTWTTGLLTPYQTGSFTVFVQVSAAAVLNSIIGSAFDISHTATDVTPSNNHYVGESTVTGSFDPNEITVDHATLTNVQVTNGSWLNYVVYFQNTGNDTAFNIDIVNPVNAMFFDLSSLEIVSSSFPVNLQYSPWEQHFHFKMNNILLPDSNINEPLSHGFIHFRIKPNSQLNTGDTIFHTAYIYFDFNEAEKTNDVSTAIVTASAISDQTAENEMVVYPNPVYETLYIQTERQAFEITVFDLTGSIVMDVKLTGNDKLLSLNLKKLAPGPYMLQITDKSGSVQRTFIKQ